VLDMLNKLSDKAHVFLLAEKVNRFVGFILADMAYPSHLVKSFPQANISCATSMKFEQELVLLRPRKEEYEGLLNWVNIY
jgi:hypothetical protein